MALCEKKKHIEWPTFQFELLVLFDVEEPEWAVLSEDVVADCKEIFTLFDTDNVKQFKLHMSLGINFDSKNPGWGVDTWGGFKNISSHGEKTNRQKTFCSLLRHMIVLLHNAHNFFS